MKPHAALASAFVLLATFALSPAGAVEPPKLYPEIEPYDHGFLKVSDLHEIYYEQVGNPEGIPIFFLHGGPGSGCGPVHRRYYDPTKFRAILHDQRGAGRSRPFAELKENTTQDLVADIERLRNHLKIDKMILLGGSWGSTLALAYAEAHPERVSGLILRGIYTATEAEMEYFYGAGTATYFPEVAEKLWKDVPEMPGKTRPQRLLTLLDGPASPERLKAARAWAAYETKVARLHTTDAEVEASVGSGDPSAFSRIENHYMANGCFLEEGQLWRDLDKIRKIPAVIINGRYDVICPPKTAYRLHKEMPGSELVIVEAAGHSGGEPGIEQAILAAVKRFER